MADSTTSADCPFDEPFNMTDGDAVDWDAELFDQFGEYDTYGPFSERDAYPGPK
jgi:hypothetical protein